MKFWARFLIIRNNIKIFPAIHIGLVKIFTQKDIERFLNKWSDLTMTTSEYRKKAGMILKKHYSEGVFVVMIFLIVYIFINIWDAAQIAFILYNNNSDTSGLFSSGSIWEAILKVLSAMLSLAVLTPILTGGLWWFYQTACGNDNMNILKLYTGFKLNLRALLLYAVMWVLSMLSLLPTGICWSAASYLFNTVSQYTNQAVVLFIVLQIFMLGVFLIGLYIKCILSMIFAPFVFINHPDMNIFKIIHKSRKIIYGSKLECLKLILTYIPAMLPIITIPFILPRTVMAMSVMAQDKIGGSDWEE